MNRNKYQYLLLVVGALGTVLFPLVLTGCGGSNNGGNGNDAGLGFRPPVRHEVGGSLAPSLCAADLNEDGWRDLITLDASGQMKILFGSRTGFSAPATRPAGDSPLQCLALDFDRDGHEDVAVLQRDARAFTIWHGKGDGTFDSNRSYPLRAKGVRMAAMDVDGDRFPDLAVVSANGTSDGFRVSVYRGGAAGAFEEWWNELDPLQGIRDIAISDVDRDGTPDLVLSFWEEGTPIRVYPGRGDGTFRDALDLPSLAIAPDRHDGTNRVAAADVTGDGRPDLITTHDIGNYQMVAVRPSLATGGFGDALRMPTDRPDSIAVNDLNGDELPDLVVANIASSAITCYLNRGDGTFGAGRLFPVGGSEQKPAALALADYDRDGLPDVAVLNQATSSITILHGTAW